MQLEPVSLQNPLPMDAQPPVVAAPLGDRLHVFARDPNSGRVGSCSVDAKGAAGESRQLSLDTVVAAVPCGDLIVVTGSRAGGPGVMGVADGTARWSAAVEPHGELGAWPLPVCGNGRVGLIWWTKPTTLQVAQLEGETARSTATLNVGGPIDGLDAAASNGTMVAAVATAESLSLYKIADGSVGEGIPVSAERAVAPGICAVESDLVVAWISPSNGEVRLRRFAGPEISLPRHAGEGRGGGSVEVIVTADQGERLRSMRLLGAYRDKVALTWTVSQGGQRGDLAVQQFAAVYDATRGESGPPQALGPGGAYLAGGWIGDALVVIHGADAPLASVFRLSA